MATRKKKPQEKEKILLLDVSSLVYRAYHALPEFTTAQGEPAGALYGFVSILLKVWGDRKPTHVIAAVDLPGKTFRHKQYAAYKATRPATPPELIAQLRRSRELLETLGVPVLGAQGFEADDVIAAVVGKTRAVKPEAQIEIVSSDADVLQLVDDHTVVLAPRRSIGDLSVLTPKGVEEKLGVGPELVTAYKALRGDPSDNILGVPGVGEKTAVAFLRSFGSLEELLKRAARSDAHASKELRRFAKILRDRAGRILQDRELVTLRRDAPVVLDFDAARMGDTARPAFVAALKRLGFESLIRRAGARRAGKKTASDHRDLERFIAEQEAQVRREIDAAEKGGIFSREIAKLERMLVPVISAMERHGMLVDRPELTRLADRFQAQRSEIEREIFALSGRTFNLASPKQLGDVLFTQLGIAANRKTGGGKPSTAAAVLESLVSTHPVVAKILRWRELQKLLSTYVETLPALVDPRDGRIHAKFWQLGTATGRIASSDPNLQNIPVRGEDGRAVRNVFIAPEGSVLLAADYSQIELRVAAVLSSDSEMLSVFRRGEDIHAATASRVFKDSSISAIEQRRIAKVLNFGILYGMGPRRVSQEAGVSFEEAQAFLDEYLATYPQLSLWLTRTREEARRIGYTVTAFGRKRVLPEIHSENPMLRSQAERAAVNAPIQGTEADLVKRGMAALKETVPEATMVVTVHDDIVCEVRESDLPILAPRVRKVLEDVWPQSPIPFPVKLTAGSRWGELTLWG
ncbi:MAG: hypothetical protein HY475_02590 [Candidatus Terrybacteria bacterium]|nr:hypothetical protein [Candidatus Terrybacteria bacterium]